MSLSLIGRIRGLLPFIGVMFTVFRFVSMSLGASKTSSPILIPVSFSIWRTVDVTVPVPDMSKSISCSVGMNGSFSVIWYFGGIHVMCWCLAKAEYVSQNLVFVLLFHFEFARYLTFSGFKRLQVLATWLSDWMRERIVSSALPSFLWLSRKSKIARFSSAGVEIFSAGVVIPA